MNYWLTTHWPRPQGTPNSEPYADVWVKNGQWKPFENACNVQPNVTHGAPSPAEAPFVSLDIKLDQPSEACLEDQGGFLAAGYEQPIGEGCFGRRIEAPWFRLIFLRMPPKTSLSLLEEAPGVAIPLSGKYSVSVKGLEEIRSRHQAHFAPAGVEWKISNDFDEEVHAVVAIVNG